MEVGKELVRISTELAKHNALERTDVESLANILMENMDVAIDTIHLAIDSCVERRSDARVDQDIDAMETDLTFRKMIHKTAFVLLSRAYHAEGGNTRRFVLDVMSEKPLMKKTRGLENLERYGGDDERSKLVAIALKENVMAMFEYYRNMRQEEQPQEEEPRFVGDNDRWRKRPREADEDEEQEVELEGEEEEEDVEEEEEEEEAEYEYDEEDDSR